MIGGVSRTGSAREFAFWASHNVDFIMLSLHGNDGASDQHVPATRRNLQEWQRIESMLPGIPYVVLEVKNGLDGVPYILEYLRRNEIAP